MPYSPVTWVDGVTKLGPTNLNHLEQGVKGADDAAAAALAQALVDATVSSKGVIQLAGDLAGTAASPQIAAGAIVNADISASAAIAKSKLASLGIVDADVAVGAAIAPTKLQNPGTTTDFLRGDGTWTTPPGAGGGGLPADTVIAAATRIIANMTTAGDAQPAWRVLGSGQMEWGPGGSTATDTVLSRGAAGRLHHGSTTQKGTLRVFGGAVSDDILETLVTTDAQLRWFVRADGQMQWGDGTATQDTSLYRIAAGTLWLGTSSQRGRLRAFGASSFDNAYETIVTTDAQLRWLVQADGKMQWGDGTAVQDTTFARFAAGAISLGTASQKGKLRSYGGATTDNAFETIVTTDAQLRWFVRADGQMQWGPGNAAQDVTLYRSAADRLKTDDLIDATTLAFATKVKTGTPVDADWAAAPPDGTIVADSTVNRLWMRIGGAWVKPPAITYSATPPASPADGDEWVLPVDATNGVMWRFRYNASSGSAYKWEFVGGISIQVSGDSNTLLQSLTQIGVTGYYYWNNASGKVTVPRAGVYRLQATAFIAYSTASAQATLAAANVTSSVVPIGNSRRDSHLDATVTFTTLATADQATFAANDVVAPVFSGSANYTVRAQSFDVLPARVS